MICSMLLTLGLGFAMITLPATAETPEQERIKQLEQENDELRQELAQLRLTLSQIKRELKQQSANTEKVDAGEAVERDKATDKDAKEKDTPRTFRSADEIYRAIPQDIQPARDGWSIVAKEKVAGWLSANIPGQRFSANKKIASVRVVRNHSEDNQWHVYLIFEYETMRYMNWKMSERLSTVRLSGDGAFVERVPKLFSKGKSVNVQGEIKRISWNAAIIQKAGEAWHPTYCEIALEQPRIR